jgi:hypothetical protein
VVADGWKPGQERDGFPDGLPDRVAGQSGAVVPVAGHLPLPGPWGGPGCRGGYRGPGPLRYWQVPASGCLPGADQVDRVGVVAQTTGLAARLVLGMN